MVNFPAPLLTDTVVSSKFAAGSLISSFLQETAPSMKNKRQYVNVFFIGRLFYKFDKVRLYKLLEQLITSGKGMHMIGAEIGIITINGIDH